MHVEFLVWSFRKFLRNEAEIPSQNMCCSSLLADEKYIEEFCRQSASSDRGGVSGKSLEWKPSYYHEGTLFSQ